MRKLIDSARFFLKKKTNKRKKKENKKKINYLQILIKVLLLQTFNLYKKKIILRCGWLKFVNIYLNLVSPSLTYTFYDKQL